MPSGARGAAYALVTVGFVLVALTLFFFSLNFDLAQNTEGNAQIRYAQAVGAGMMGGVGFLALVVGIVMFMVSGERAAAEPKAPAMPPERIG